jgi:hypothetical protein
MTTPIPINKTIIAMFSSIFVSPLFEVHRKDVAHEGKAHEVFH